MEEILRNAFDKIRADDELKRRIICYLSCKKKEIEERGYVVWGLPVLLFIGFILFLFLILM